MHLTRVCPRRTCTSPSLVRATPRPRKGRDVAIDDPPKAGPADQATKVGMSMDRLFTRSVCINLDRRPDRWRRMRERLGRLGMGSVARVPATDGRSGQVPAAWAGREGAYGCLVSHRAVAAAAWADGVESLLVLEDDVEFDPEVDPKLRAALAELPDDWTFLYIGGSHRVRPEPVGAHVGRCVSTLSTYAYAVRRPALRRLLALDDTRPEPIDVQLARAQREEAFHCATPNLAWVECDHSDILGTLTHHWYLKESLVFGETCDPDMAGRVALVLPLDDPAWRDVGPDVAAFLVEHIRGVVPGLHVVSYGGPPPTSAPRVAGEEPSTPPDPGRRDGSSKTRPGMPRPPIGGHRWGCESDEGGMLPPGPQARAIRAFADLEGRVDYAIVAGAPVLLTRSHILATLQMCRRYPVVNPFRSLVTLSAGQTSRVLDGRPRDFDPASLERVDRDGLELGWGFFRRGPAKCDGLRNDPEVYRVPGFGLLLRSHGPSCVSAAPG